MKYKVEHSISDGRVEVSIEDNLKVEVSLGGNGGGGGIDCNGIATCINAATNKPTPVNADRFGIWDSVTGFLNNVTWQNIISSIFNIHNLITTTPHVTDGEKTTWNGKQDALGFTPENVANKKTFENINTNSDTDYLAASAVAKLVDQAVAQIGARFYMLDAADALPAYKQTSITASLLGTATDQASTNVAADTLIHSWISPAGFVWTSLASGIYDLFCYAQRTAGNINTRLYWQFYELLADNVTEVLIATSNLSDLITAKRQTRTFAILSEGYTPSVGSRLVGKVYMRTLSGGSNTTLQLSYQGTEASHWEIPISQEYLESTFQAILVSGTNIKTINSQSLLGADDIVSIQTVTIAVANWSGGLTCTKAVTGVLITSAIDVIIESQTEGDKWAGSNVYALPVTVDGQIDFTAETTPTDDITFKVRIW